MPSRTITAAVLATATACALAEPALAQQPSPVTTTTNAVNRLVNDTNALGDADAAAGTRGALRRDAIKISRAAFRKPCKAIRSVSDYRSLLPRVNDTKPTLPENRPGNASKRGTLERDALAVDAGLKQLPGTRRCGGGATKASSGLAAHLRRSNKKVLKMHVTLPVARWEARSGGGSDFIGLNMDGSDALGAVGDPAVPAFTRMFAVPRGARISVRVKHVRGYTLDGIELFPKQEQAVDADPSDDTDPEIFADKPFEIDRGAYRSKAAVPRRLAYAKVLGKMRDLRVGSLQIPGAQYDPRKQRARIFTSMDVTVTFKKSGNWRPKRVRTALERPFERIYRTSLDNYGAVARGANTRAREAATTPTCGEEYLIVTSPALHDAAEKLAEAKQGQGMSVAIHDVEPGTSNVDVRSFIRGELDSKICTRPTFVEIIGDTSHVPSFDETWCDPASSPDCTVTSDLSYSLNGVGTDLFADVLVGRIPAPNLDVATATVSKIVTYETELPAPEGDDFYNHATVTSNFDGVGPRDGRGFTLSAERMRAGLRSRGHVVTRLNSALASADIQQFKDGTPIPDELKRPATAWTDGREQVISELNAGRFLFVHRDHGSRFGWANPAISINDVAQLNSDSTKLPVVIAINCSSAAFQFPGQPSFDERLLQRVGGGAVAVIGDTGVSPTVQNDQLTVGYADAMFPDTVPGFGSATPLKQMGQILVAGKSYMASQAPATSQLTGNVRREHLLWHLLGDPSMEMRTATPTAFDTTQIKTRFVHRRDQFPIGDPPFQVSVTSTQPGTDGTLVTLLHAGQVIGRGTISGGVALITPTVRTDSASISVTLERDNFLQKTLPVSAPVPHLTLTCPSSVQAFRNDNVLVTGTVSPAVSGATVKFRVTHANGTITTQTVRTLSNSTYAIKLVPLTTADRPSMKVEAFYDGELKYGADDVSCIVPIT